MARNLKYQFKNSIDKQFKEGMDKHSLKVTEGQGNGRIFSYSDRKNLVDFSCNFANHIKANFKDIKMARDIRTEHIQSFFNEKAKICSKATLEQYRSRFCKLETVVNKTYNINANYSKGYILPISKENSSKIRDIAMSQKDYTKLQEVIKDSASTAKIGIELSARFGLRVSEVVKMQGRDIDLQNNIIRIIDSKGGRDREIKIEREQDREYCRSITQEIGERQRLVPLREDSVNVFLRRSLEKCNSESKYKECKTGIHSIRKMAAQNYYDRCREKGESIKDALQMTSMWLGHGKERMELMNEYIADIK
ncbi:MAG: tyrosine-type recombinase/integrase [Clostridium sp.]